MNNKLIRFFNDHSQRVRDGSIHLKSFAHDERGAIAYLTALLAGVLLIAAGLAVDYGLAIVTKSKIDHAAQSAVNSGANAARNLMEANLTTKDGVEAKALGEGQQVALSAFDAQKSSEATVTYRSVDFAHVGNTLSGNLAWQGRYTPQIASMMRPITIEGNAKMIVGIMDIKPQTRVLDEKWSDPGETIPPKNLTGNSYRDWKSFVYSPRIEPTGDVRVPGYALSIGGHWAAQISKKVFLYAGNYQLRYWYKSAVIFPEYEPAHICGPTQQTIAWSTSGKMREIGSSTVLNGNMHASRIATFLHPEKTNPNNQNMQPIWNANLHNRIDICIYSSRWIERSINLEITDTGYYWLGFSSEAPIASNPRGGWLANIQLCVGTCSSTDVDNFPYAKNTLIFSDSFDTAKPEGTIFDGTSGTISQDARYEVPPSTQWTFAPVFGSTVSPTVFMWSKTPPLKDGPQYLMAKFTSQKASVAYGGGTAQILANRRLLLTAGRYLFTMSGRGDGNALSSACPNVRAVPDLSGGSSTCSSAAYQAVWRDLPLCVALHSTQFYEMGLLMAGKFDTGEARADGIKIVALYSNTLKKFSPDREFCTMVMDHLPASDPLHGARLTYDRVVVIASWWQ